MTLTKQLKTDIKIFMRDFGISKTALSVNALKNRHAIDDFLQKDASMTLKSADAVYRFIERFKKEYGKNVS